MKNDYAKKRAKVDAIKLARGCADCGFKRWPESLDFDHLPGTVKTSNIAQFLSRSWKRIEAEIAKCEVVCANCHRHRTRIRNEAKGDAWYEQ